MSLSRWFSYCPRCGGSRAMMEVLGRIEGSPDVELLRCTACRLVWDSSDAGEWLNQYVLRSPLLPRRPRIERVGILKEGHWVLWVHPEWNDGYVTVRRKMAYTYDSFEQAVQGLLALADLLAPSS